MTTTYALHGEVHREAVGGHLVRALEEAPFRSVGVRVHPLGAQALALLRGERRHLQHQHHQLVQGRGPAGHRAAGRHVVAAHAQPAALEPLQQRAREHHVEQAAAHQRRGAAHQRLHAGRARAAGLAVEEVRLERIGLVRGQLAQGVVQQLRGAERVRAHAASRSRPMQACSCASARWRMTRTFPGVVPSSCATSSPLRSA